MFVTTAFAFFSRKYFAPKNPPPSPKSAASAIAIAFITVRLACRFARGWRSIFPAISASSLSRISSGATSPSPSVSFLTLSEISSAIAATSSSSSFSSETGSSGAFSVGASPAGAPPIPTIGVFIAISLTASSISLSVGISSVGLTPSGPNPLIPPSGILNDPNSLSAGSSALGLGFSKRRRFRKETSPSIFSILARSPRDSFSGLVSGFSSGFSAGARPSAARVSAFLASISLCCWRILSRSRFAASSAFFPSPSAECFGT